MNPDHAGTLLIALTRQGTELQAHGDRLRYRPRSAMTPELAERVKAHRSGLLAMLRGDRAPQLPRDGQKRPTTGVSSAACPARERSQAFYEVVKVIDITLFLPYVNLTLSLP